MSLRTHFTYCTVTIPSHNSHTSIQFHYSINLTIKFLWAQGDGEGCDMEYEWQSNSDQYIIFCVSLSCAYRDNVFSYTIYHNYHTLLSCICRILYGEQASNLSPNTFHIEHTQNHECVSWHLSASICFQKIFYHRWHIPPDHILVQLFVTFKLFPTFFAWWYNNTLFASFIVIQNIYIYTLHQVF